MLKIKQIRPHTILVIVILVIFCLVIAVNVIFGGIDRISNAEDDLGNIHALLAIEDSEGLVSTQFFVLNTQTKRGALIDIPPYLGVILDTNDNLDRIDTLIRENNFDEFLTEVEELTGQVIDFYLWFTVEEFVSFVDLLEGVRFFIISIPDSETQQLPSGDVVLDGEKIEEYIFAYRNEPDSKLRIEGLQNLLYHTILTIADNQAYLSHRDVLDQVYRLVRTNLSKNELEIVLTEIMYGINAEGVQNWLTQGDVRSVVVGDRRESLLFLDLNGRWFAETVEKVGSQIIHRHAVQSSSEQGRLRILNGTSVSGLARRTRLLYEQFGYQVVEVGNYQNQNITKTRLVNHNAVQEAAEGIADIINMSAEQIEQSTSDESADYDFTLILGQDFDGVNINQDG